MYKTGNDQFDAEHPGVFKPGSVLLLAGETKEHGQRRAELTVSLFRNNRVNVFTHVACMDLDLEFKRQHAAISGIPLRELVTKGENYLEVQANLAKELEAFARIESGQRREYGFTPLNAAPSTRAIVQESLNCQRHPWIVVLDYDDPHCSILGYSNRDDILEVFRRYATNTDRLVILTEAPTEPRSAYEEVLASQGKRYRDCWIVDLTHSDPFKKP